MLKFQVDMGDKEMQRIECYVLEEFPPIPEPKEKLMHVRTTQDKKLLTYAVNTKSLCM